MDDNDNGPQFDREVYDFTVPYSKENVSVVGKVQALDRDAPGKRFLCSGDSVITLTNGWHFSGPNSAVSYSLAYLHDFFTVDEYSGIISTKRDLQFHGTTFDNMYKIRVIATDAGSPPMSSECEVTVKVVGSNDFAPTLVKSGEDDVTYTAVPSGAEVDTEVYKVLATDPDSSDLTFGIVGGNGSEYFKIHPTSGSVLTSGLSLRIFDPLTVLELKIVVFDGGIPNRTDTMAVFFVTTAENLHAPEFQSSSTRIFIREDEQIGNTIVTVKAVDNDQGINGQVRSFWSFF